MKFLGFEISKKNQLQNLSSPGSFWPIIRESFTGAWQQNIEISADAVLAYHAIFACVTLIQNDIGKLRHKLVAESDGIWEETTSPSFSPVLRRPNRYQNHIQFKEWWINCKLTRGNSYGLKGRDQRGVVTNIYLLEPSRVKPLVSPQGSVFYQLNTDNLSGLEKEVTVPASEIIHDRMNCLFHPLVGLSPIFASGLSAVQGLAIQNNSSRLFNNMSRPSGILTAPGAISADTATRLKAAWDAAYSGENFGKTAVLGDGLKYERMSITAVEAQLIEQLKWTAEVVCSTFHVPPFKIGIGPLPTYQNAELLNQIYYSDCLQSLIEQYEACMDEGLGLDVPVAGRMMGVELDLDGLLRMDTATKIKTLAEGVAGALYTPNEARKKLDSRPLTGGNTIYMQQQNYSLEALSRRDAKDDPFAPNKAPEPETPKPEAEEEPDDEEQQRQWQQKALDTLESELDFVAPFAVSLKSILELNNQRILETMRDSHSRGAL